MCLRLRVYRLLTGVTVRDVRMMYVVSQAFPRLSCCGNVKLMTSLIVRQISLVVSTMKIYGTWLRCQSTGAKEHNANAMTYVSYLYY